MFRKLKMRLKASRFFSPIYERLKKLRDEISRRQKLHGKYKFEDRSVGSNRLCIVLAGYKEYLYPAVMGRLKKHAPPDMDVCILTSGLYSKTVSDLCADNGWSYLSTKRNNVSLIQNIAINLYPKAEYIFKLDEDIFITQGYFENMIRAYRHAEEGDYFPGVLAPLIPINGYGNVRILQKTDFVDTYTELFEKPKIYLGRERLVESSAEAAQFFWGGVSMPSIDEMNARFSKESLDERPCAIRFSIGAILFKRSFWNDMKMFPVGKGSSMGADELHLCISCCSMSRPLMVSENVVVGHFSFGGQNKAMKEYYMQHKELFLG